MATKAPKLEITVAEMAVTLKNMGADVAEIKSRLDIMDENFARKDDVEKNAAAIISLRNDLQTLEIKMAVANAQTRTWGIVGGILITFIAAIISTLHFDI